MVFNLEDVSLTIGEKKILKDISVGFEQHKFNAIIGPNGSGKSTMIKLLAKLSKPTTGRVTFMGNEVANVKRKDFAAEVAFFFQFNNVNADVTVKQMVYFGRRAHKSLYSQMNNKDKEIVTEAIKKCDLQELEERNVDTLSGGEQQRVYLAMILAQEPKTIVLDEPTNHLDIHYQFQLLTLVKSIMEEQDITIICILHDLNHVLKYADNTVLLKGGAIFKSGKTELVITSDNVLDVFKINSIIYEQETGKHIDFVI